MDDPALEAAKLLNAYVVSRPALSVTGENAKAQCLFQALLIYTDEQLLSLHKVRWGCLPPGQSLNMRPTGYGPHARSATLESMMRFMRRERLRRWPMVFVEIPGEKAHFKSKRPVRTSGVKVND